jgi:hypothetical protein
LVDRRKFQWSARKLMHTLQFTPDKVRAIAWFGNGEAFGFSKGGEGVLFTMLMNLRGRLVQVKTDDPFLYAVAAIDGADPQTPRPEALGEGKELVVTVFNDHPTARPVELAIKAPAGLKFGKITVRQPKFTDEEIEIVEKTEATDGSAHAFKGELPAHGIVSLSVEVTGNVGDKSEAHIRQGFSPALLTMVTPDKPSTQKIALKDLKGAKRAWLRIVAERLAEGEGVAVVNGKEYALPKAVTPENAPWIRDMPVALADVKEQNEIAFKAAPGHAGYTVATASLFVESD